MQRELKKSLKTILIHFLCMNFSDDFLLKESCLVVICRLITSTNDAQLWIFWPKFQDPRAIIRTLSLCLSLYLTLEVSQRVMNWTVIVWNMRRGDLMVSALSPDRAGLVRAMGLCCSATTFTLTLPLSTQVYKWWILCWWVTLQWTSIPSRGE